MCCVHVCKFSALYLCKFNVSRISTRMFVLCSNNCSPTALCGLVWIHGCVLCLLCAESAYSNSLLLTLSTRFALKYKFCFVILFSIHLYLKKTTYSTALVITHQFYNYAAVTYLFQNIYLRLWGKNIIHNVDE